MYMNELGNPNSDMHFRVEAWNTQAQAWHIIKVHGETRLSAVRLVYDSGYDNIGEFTVIE